MAMLFVEKVLSWHFLVGKLYFFSLVNKKLDFFTIRRHAVHNKLGMKRLLFLRNEEKLYELLGINLHDIDFILTLVLSFWVFHTYPILFTITKSISEVMLCMN